MLTEHLALLGTSMADDGTLADTSPSFSSTGEDESTSGARAGVVQDITDAAEIFYLHPQQHRCSQL